MVLKVEGLVKQYGSLRAVDGVSFAVGRGEVFGLLGPNGAGKTSIIETLVGLRPPDGGRVRVLGYDPGRHRRALHRRVGLQLQKTSLYPDLRVDETLRLFARLYGATPDIHGALARVGLTKRSRTRVKHLSGGEGRRLTLAMALLNDPELIFLDEPTAGMDPAGRRSVWKIVESLRSGGATVILTTHLMDEAEALCHRVLFLRAGRVIAVGPPRELITTRRVNDLDELYMSLMGGAV